MLAAVLAGCGGKGPQRPSRWLGKAVEPDTAQLALMELNQRLAFAADEQLLQLSQEQEETYALYQSNTWIHFYDRGDTSQPALKRNEECTVHMTVYNLEGRLLLDSEASYILGQYKLPLCIEFNLQEWAHGTHARLLVPWYSAFGMQGQDGIPPYENVIIDLYIQ